MDTINNGDINPFKTMVKKMGPIVRFTYEFINDNFTVINLKEENYYV